ncbi:MULTISPECIES: SDR family oxidoreductase [unclassified Pseudomonas]|uniref:SDR family oxidoreductase n=1 Tax=unclassified Pseudomonas TaxID=196821 RepID=UPI000EAA49D6|nr:MULTISPECIES: SDR family oxidoreductase [unclassified Pseudomonas]AYF85784.1 SDR family oxidoreductase [Pseudomonas sp. DY-1]MDH4654975.1 SDR family oxidoreductase [Pseudomonas sp. BN606]MRK19466.1 SDR family oxidoreductase [Pseudomonas sp. JG-B]
MRLADCRVLLTGASGGIGLALVEQLCVRGAQVLAVSRHPETLAGLRQRFPHQLSWVGADLRQAAGRQRALEAARGMGGINVLMNAAGVNAFAMLEQVDDGQIEDMLALNVTATLQLTRALLPLLRQQSHGLVVNVGSTYGSIGYPGYAVYCASKFALRGFSEALRRELADTPVNVLYVAPRATRTSMNSQTAMALNAELKVGVDEPEQVAGAVIAAIEKDLSELYLGWPEKFFVRLNSMLPGVVDRALHKQLPIIRRFSNLHHGKDHS